MTIGASWLITLLGVALVVGCAGPPPGGAPGTTSGPAAPTGPKRITATIIDEPVGFNGIMAYNRGGGNDVMEDLLHAGVANYDNRSVLFPQLAETLPSVESGTWTVLPDGRMETVWTLRANAQWQDGTAFTTKDLLFTLEVAQTRDIPVRGHVAYQLLGGSEAIDAHTLRLQWTKPFIDADKLFMRTFAPPLPEHLVRRAYTEDRGSFADLPYWTEAFVGAGPYRLKEWARGSHIVLAANDSYVLGKPKIDEIVMRFIGDPNTIVASLLSGAVELTLGRNLTLEPASQVRDQWQEGRLELAYKSWIMMYPQLLTPSPAVVGNLDFRRALMHALDRQQLVDSLQGGLVPVAHMMLSPDTLEHKESLGSIVRYENDPRRAVQLIDSLGYTRRADGGFRNTAGERLAVEVRATAGEDVFEKSVLAVGDYWQRIGVAVEPVIVPRQRDQDLEYITTFPGFNLTRQPNQLEALGDHRISQAPLPENGYRGRNRARYLNPEFDALVDRYFSTIPRAERLEIVKQVMHHITTNLTMMGLFYNTEPTLISNRLTGVTARTGDGTHAWNAHLWDVQ